jgi:succinoglycan biosynthesis transport protein ExoP
MRVVDLLGALRRRWFIIAACAILCAGVAGVYSKVTTKIYRAAAVISVSPAKFDYGSGLAAQQLLANYAVNITRPDVLSSLDKQLNLDISPTQLATMITATSDNTALTITVTVDDTDPNRAAAIANTLTNIFITTQTQYNLAHLNPDVDAHLVQPAVAPGGPNRPKTKINVLAGLLLDVWDDRLRTEHDVEAGLGMALLGAIPHFQGVALPQASPPSDNGRLREHEGIGQPVGGTRR